MLPRESPGGYPLYTQRQKSPKTRSYVRCFQQSLKQLAVQVHRFRHEPVVILEIRSLYVYMLERTELNKPE